MEKQLKDYIHFYLNPFHKTKVLIDDEEIKYLWDIDVADGEYVNFTAANDEFRSIEGKEEDGWMVYNDDETLSRIKPILRKLSSMTEEEAWTAWKKGGEHSRHNGVCNYVSAFKNPGTDLGMNIFDWSATINYMRSVGIDCDKLIESGLAIDSATLNH